MPHTNKQLQLIEQQGEMPQLYQVGEQPSYSPEMVSFCDKLHDLGHVELSLMILKQQTRLDRLVAFSQLIMAGEMARQDFLTWRAERLARIGSAELELSGMYFQATGRSVV